MSAFWVLTIILCIGAIGYFLGVQRAEAQSAAARTDRLDRNSTPVANKVFAHSLPRYHGWLVFMFAVLPALLLLLIWSSAATFLVEQNIAKQLPANVSNASLSVGMVHNVADALETLHLDAATAPATYAQLRPIASAAGINLPESGEDYMIGAA